jgi:hypothetical protein
MASGGSVGGDSIKVASPKWKTYMYKTGDRHCWRGIYNWDEEEDEQWKASLKDFPYKVRYPCSSGWSLFSALV